MTQDQRFYPPANFAAVPPEYADYRRARVVVLPVPYDSTASGWGGSREGPAAIIEASGNMELYDIGLGREPYLVGIHTLPEVAPHAGSPAAMVERVEAIVGELVDDGKFVVTLGGEHTIAIGAARAYAQRVRELSVLAFDANADLRDTYLDTPYNHACTLRRILEAGPDPPKADEGPALSGAEGFAPVVQVGLRSATREEHDFIQQRRLAFYSPVEYRDLGPQVVVEQLSKNVYITIDLDAFDPSQVAAVGTPEPGGLLWDEVCRLLEVVAASRRIVGFDVTELAPALGPKANAQLAAKLTYRLIGLAVQE